MDAASITPAKRWDTATDALIYTWTHGTRGFVLAYGTIALFMAAGFKQRRAGNPLYIALPLLAVPTLIGVAIASTVILWVLGRFGIAFGSHRLLPSLTLYGAGGPFSGVGER